jgi:hypothetical protein
MKLTCIKSLAAKLSLATMAMGAFLVTGTAPAHAQQWGATVQYATPTYAVDRDANYRTMERRQYERERARELKERRQREEFLRRQAWLRERREHRDYRYR